MSKRIYRGVLAFFLACSVYGCKSKTTAAEDANFKPKSSMKEASRKTNQDGSIEVTMNEGSTFTFPKGTSEQEIQKAINSLQGGVQKSEGSLNGGDDTDQSQDIEASDADSIETFE